MVLKLKYPSIFQKGLNFHLANTLLNKDENTYLHSHDFFEIFFLQQGKIKHLINKEIYEVSPDEICFIKPSDEHCFTKTTDAPSALMTNIAFTPEFYTEVSSFLFKDASPEEIPVSSSPVTIDPLLQEQLKIQTNRLMHRHKEINAGRQTEIIKCLLVNVFMQISQKRDYQKTDVPIWLSDTCRQMQRKENYVAGLYRMIRISGKSQEHLNRAMKKHRSITPTSFINGIRLQEAAYLLRTTHKTITDIIYETGFSNISHFNRLFREHYIHTPRKYRQNNSSIINPEK